MKKTWVKVLIIALAIFFSVGAFSGNYNCSGNLSNAVSSIVKATCYGMTKVFNGAWGMLT